MYKYETHLHTFPVSRCARASVRESLEFYREIGYDGVFITNHFLDGNININPSLSYEDRIHFYFSDYEAALALSGEIGIKVFLGVELTYKGTDFLIYGLDKAWFLAHPEIMDMTKNEELLLMMEAGALVIQAHPFRSRGKLGHIRLYPENVHGVEIVNVSHPREDDAMAKPYAENYGLLLFAGSDNHVAGHAKFLAGMCCQEPITDEQDFVRQVMAGNMEVFTLQR